MKWHFIVIIGLFWNCCLMAQEDQLPIPHKDTSPIGTQALTPILVKVPLPLYGQGQHTEYLDSSRLQRYKNQYLAQFLALESTFFIKNYGPSGISTISGRGGSASQTAVLWEGFNIQNSMLGQADLSLLPLFFIENIALQYGGGSSFFGSSGGGGALHLSSHNKNNYKKGLHLRAQLSAGSFESFQEGLGIGYHFVKENKYQERILDYTIDLRFFGQQAKNNFWFRDQNAFGFPKPVLRQSHAVTQQWGVLNTHTFRHKKHDFSLKTWYQYNHRQIPPTLLTQSSLDQQEDEAWRNTLHWKYNIGQLAIKARTALFWERLNFESGTVQSESKTLSSITEAEARYYWSNKHSLQAGIHYGYYQAQSQGYDNNPSQDRPAIFVHYRFFDLNKKWKLDASVRQEWVDWQIQRPAASLGLRLGAFKGWRFNAHVSHNYRLPTFNDLYWRTLGNPDLVSEYSWNSELGSSYEFKKKRYYLKFHATGFCNLVNNWILWSPNSSGLWRPDNVDQVLARGLEASTQFTTTWKKWQLQLRAQYAFTKSTRTQGEDPRTIGKQLIYVPNHQGNASASITFRNTSALLQTQWTGARYIDNSNEFSLPNFMLLHLRLEQRLNFKKGALVIYAQGNNLLGSEYQVVSNRPMPWQQFEFGLQFFL